jgi:hypothetical protein
MVTCEGAANAQVNSVEIRVYAEVTVRLRSATTLADDDVGVYDLVVCRRYGVVGAHVGGLSATGSMLVMIFRTRI